MSDKERQQFEENMQKIKLDLINKISYNMLFLPKEKQELIKEYLLKDRKK